MKITIPTEKLIDDARQMRYLMFVYHVYSLWPPSPNEVRKCEPKKSSPLESVRLVAHGTCTFTFYRPNKTEKIEYSFFFYQFLFRATFVSSRQKKKNKTLYSHMHLFRYIVWLLAWVSAKPHENSPTYRFTKSLFSIHFFFRIGICFVCRCIWNQVDTTALSHVVIVVGVVACYPSP